jgi:hypothetical protein
MKFSFFKDKVPGAMCRVPDARNMEHGTGNRFVSFPKYTFLFIFIKQN